MDLLISFIPVVVMIVAIVGFKMRGDIAGCIGWVLTVIIAFAIFNTSLEVSLLATLKGALASMAITGMGFFALLQITFMQETGALARAIVAIKTLAASDKPTQIMLLNVVMGTGLVSVGATPAIILPPIMLGLGYSIGMSIALPCIGYDSLCTFAMLAAPVVALSDILAGAGFTVNGAAPTVAYCAQYFTNYLPVITPCIAFSMLFMCGGAKLLKQGIIPALITGFGMGGTAWVISRIGFGVVLTGVMSADQRVPVGYIPAGRPLLPVRRGPGSGKDHAAVEGSVSLGSADLLLRYHQLRGSAVRSAVQGSPGDAHHPVAW